MQESTMEIVKPIESTEILLLLRMIMEPSPPLEIVTHRNYCDC
ncbi:hypothetical protein AAEY33_13925 [Peribacillus simplex]|jgi:hypothetical protein|nr:MULTISPECIES: hypothetical protein [Bacillaceae]